MTRTLVLGGARSGKSAHAERIAAQSGKEVVYVATAGAGDAEMARRIALHRSSRPGHWTTVEEPLALADTLARWRAPHRVVLVDCLTLWLSNLLFANGTDYPEVGEIALPARLHAERAALLGQLEEDDGDVVFVSNEVGMGIVPFGAVTRAYTDEAGRLNQAVAARCDNVVFVAAGLPLVLKGGPC
ncbi:adenosylcobinamide kinase /adenosylcobinamide-phosphate guanylyltransferase [Pseudoduganella flava]|uniref:Bifunctional adenosylcobalamin biosynthesis protein n=1 Tax=Pseudoduganella flava TaxID=871742 RepID=A0A562P7C6_9BURK|nr:bifunctional adenosylcobinamide kinase/adenosylcobinamide-phosphate guanylyltransferase [Pseudoduganella flava]QGZ41085.1 bifunctional adenosylcobinamide kinase/adenosylcobinamide-phosphate guanylyltransferase [Pseudoduganella flava]TWI40150.1 adenosylcobinamide kinase /adenosylcobinamide-phosphate guanylyltransferase [Pseudoduganella flava]